MRRTPAVILAAALAFSGLAPSPAGAADWPPIEPAERSMAQPLLDRSADAEALLWDVYVTDERDGDSFKTVFEHYLKIKVFTERGRDAHSKVDLPYTNRSRVRDVQARTVSPAGQVTELTAQDIFDRTIVSAAGTQLKARSFVLPSVVPGSIIEYRWREINDDALSHNVELPFQRDIGVHVVRYHARPFYLMREAGYAMKVQPFNLPNVTARPEPNSAQRTGYTIFEASRMAAFRPEPYMVPENSVKAWLLLYYTSRDYGDRSDQEFWTGYGRDTLDFYKNMWRVSGDIRTAASQALAGATTTADKIDALLRAVRQKVKRTDLGSALDLLAVRQRDERTASNTLKRGTGTADDVTLLYAALAQAGGLDVRLALLPDRSFMYSNASMKQPYFFDHLAVAVRDGSQWRFVDPADPFSPHGHVRWEHEGLEGLVIDSKGTQVVPIPNASADYSKRTRRAALRLSSDGTLEGEVTLEYTGHIAALQRARDDAQTELELKRAFDEDMARRIPGFETSGYAVKNLRDPELPYIITFSLRVPEYAQPAGTRLLVQPALMQKGRAPFFTDTQRWQSLDFRYTWSEDDEVTLDLPDGFTLEELKTPVGQVLNGGSLAAYSVKLSVIGLTVTYNRHLMFGGEGKVFFGSSSYDQFKAFFDDVRRQDEHTLTLRRSGF